MTFYEELGVPPDAPPETIRDAYRKVARLLHPDVQTDPALREPAETQMKRINHLYGVLSDIELRRRYDHELAMTAERAPTIFIQAPPAAEPFEPGNGGSLVWLAATAVCAAFIIWLSARESSSTPAIYPLQSSVAATPAKSSTRPRVPAAVSRSSSIPSNPQPAVQLDEELATLRGRLLAANSDRARLEKEMAAREVDRKTANSITLTPAPPLAAQQPATNLSLSTVLPPTVAPPSPPKPANPPHAEPAASAAPPAHWAGSWAYSQSRSEKKDKALLPPEFIETVITEEKGRIRGHYSARFKVADAGISPDVDFRFEGKVSGPTVRLPWTGTDGSKGEVQLHLVSDTTLEIVWSATNLGKSMGLDSGTAELNRKN